MFANGIPKPTPLPDYYNATRYLQEFRARYQAYWRSTAPQTNTGTRTTPRSFVNCIEKTYRPLSLRLTTFQAGPWTQSSSPYHLTPPSSPEILLLQYPPFPLCLFPHTPTRTTTNLPTSLFQHRQRPRLHHHRYSCHDCRSQTGRL